MLSEQGVVEFVFNIMAVVGEASWLESPITSVLKDIDSKMTLKGSSQQLLRLSRTSKSPNVTYFVGHIGCRNFQLHAGYFLSLDSLLNPNCVLPDSYSCKNCTWRHQG